MQVVNRLIIILIIILFHESFLRALTLPAKSETQFYHFIQPVQAPTFIKDANGRWQASGESVFFREGEYFKVERVGEDGTLWIEVPSTKNNEVVGIPSTTMKREPSKLGELDFIKQTEWLNNKFDAKIRQENVRPLKTGKANLFGRMLGVKGTGDAIVYFDAEPGKRVALTDEPATTNNIDCNQQKQGGNPCTAWPTTGDALKIMDSTISYTLDTATGEYVPRLFYRVVTTYCPDGTTEACSAPLQKNKIGWIEARRVGATKREGIPVSNNPFLLRTNRATNEVRFNDGLPCIDTLTKQVAGLSNAVSAADVTFENEVTSKVQNCLSIDYVDKYNAIDKSLKNESYELYGGHWNAILNAKKKAKVAELGNEFFKSGASPFERFVKAYRDVRPSQKVTGNSLSNQQYFEIDALARSLFGEMRGCNERSTAYYKAIARVMINRAAIVKAEGPTLPFVSSKDPSQKGRSVDVLLPDIVSANRQISSWNKDDVNLKANLCPVSNTTSPLEMQAWKTAVKVAWEVIVQRKKFLEETKNITHAHYSSGMIPSWSNEKREDLKFKVGNEWHSNSECLILWADKYNTKIEKLNNDPSNFAMLLDFSLFNGK